MRSRGGAAWQDRAAGGSWLGSVAMWGQARSEPQSRHIAPEPWYMNQDTHPWRPIGCLTPSSILNSPARQPLVEGSGELPPTPGSRGGPTLGVGSGGLRDSCSPCIFHEPEMESWEGLAGVPARAAPIHTSGLPLPSPSLPCMLLLPGTRERRKGTNVASDRGHSL